MKVREKSKRFLPASLEDKDVAAENASSVKLNPVLTSPSRAGTTICMAEMTLNVT
jgi:hypothetical protein